MSCYLLATSLLRALIRALRRPPHVYILRVGKVLVDGSIINFGALGSWDGGSAWYGGSRELTNVAEACILIEWR